MLNGFVLYSHYENYFKNLKNKDIGKLIIALFAFTNGEDISSTLSKSALAVYKTITEEITNEQSKRQKICEKNKQNILKRWQKQKNTTVCEPDTTVLNEDTTVSKGVYDRINEPYDRINQPKNEDTTVLNEDTTVSDEGINKYNNIINKQTSLVSLKENIFNNYNNTACVREKSPTEREPFKKFFKETFDYCFSDKFLKSSNEIIDIMIEAFNQSKTHNGLKFNQTIYNSDSILEVFAKIDSDKFNKIVNQITFNENIENRAVYILGSLIKASSQPKCTNTNEQIIQLKQDLETNPAFAI